MAEKVLNYYAGGNTAKGFIAFLSSTNKLLGFHFKGAGMEKLTYENNW